MLAIAIVSFLVVSLTVLAFVIKDSNGKGMLYAVGIAFWLLESFLLWNMTWPAGNTYFGYAAILVGISMVIVMSVMTLNTYLFSRRIKSPTYEDEKASDRARVYKITHKKKSLWD